jgi:hypothetical protein
MKRLSDLRVLSALTLLFAAGGLAWHGQPSLDKKWELLAPKLESRLLTREVYIDPAELLDLINDDYVHLVIYDVRSEPYWNEFRLVDSEHMPLDRMPGERDRLLALPENAVVVVVSNDEMLASKGWKRLMVIARPNAYILEGGLNHWLNVYGIPEEEVDAHGRASLSKPDGTLRHRFKLALGDRHASSRPDEHRIPDRAYTSRVRLMKKVAKAGGCD